MRYINKNEIIVPVTVVLLFSIIFYFAGKADRRNSMSYCERLDYDLENTHFINQKNSILFEKMVALQSGKCK